MVDWKRNTGEREINEGVDGERNWEEREAIKDVDRDKKEEREINTQI